MTLTAYLAGSTTGLRVKIGGLGLTTSADGSVGIGSIIFDDPDGTLLVRAWMKVIVIEDACLEAPVLFSGYVLSKRYSRSDGASTYRAGKSRYIHTNLLDENAVLHTRLITGLDGKRPAETRNDRLQWLLESVYLNGLIEETELVSSGEENFEEASYLGQYADDVLMDISAPINRIFFVYLVQPDGDRGLFFDRSTAVIGDSTLSISNDPDDESDTCFYPLIDAELEKDGSEVYDNGRYKYKNGVVLGHNDDTKAEFFDDNGLLHRGIAIDNSRVGQESTARTFLARILDRDSSENDTVTVTITVPAESSGLIQAGHRVPIKFVHLETEGFGGDDFVYSRVTELTLTNASDGTLNNYDIAMRLNTKGLPGGGGGGAPGPGEFPHEPPADQSPDVTGDVCNTVIEDSVRTGEADIGGLAIEGEFWYFEVIQSSHTAGAVVTGLELTSVGVAPDLLYDLLSLWTPVEIGTGAGSPPLPLRSGTFFVGPQTVGGAAQFHLRVDADYLGPGVTVDECFHIEMWKGGPPTTETPPPDPGQEVPWAVVDMTLGDTFSIGATQFGYAFDTLKVKVDGVLISPASIEQTDPACGLFKLLWVIDDDEVVTVSYDGI